MNHYQLEEYQKKGFIILPKIPLFLEEAIEGKMQRNQSSLLNFMNLTKLLCGPIMDFIGIRK